MFYINKIVWFFMNPFMIGLSLAMLGMFFLLKNRKKIGIAISAAAISWSWIFSSATGILLLGVPLEKPFLEYQSVDSLPKADAIVVLGGGMSHVKALKYPDISDGGDRVWHAARLWKAGKANFVILSGSNDDFSAKPFLIDLGVPKENIIVDDKSRNTYENSRFTEALIKEKFPEKTDASILLVTSAWHMTRSLGNFSKTSLKAIPAPCDFKAHNIYFWSEWHDFIFPSYDGIAWAGTFMKEWIGRLARR